ncbi:MAG: C4-type zinc ribbon domain-containing protein [Actinomycetota bacterium]|nr:C4-type zinc ribbon domain-containing protein [Actinomycetota bacterium]
MVKNVDLSALQRLLEIQDHDSAIARLTHRKSTLPEARRLSEVRGQLEELQADLEIAQKQAQEVTREQDRLEGEIQILEQKLTREEHRLFSGGVSNPKELSSLQAEVAMLKKKRSELEDGLLEVMVQREDAVSTEDRLRSEHADASKEAETLTLTVEKLRAELDVELDGHQKARTELLPGVPEDILKLYEQIRSSKGGVGVARLRGGTCEGCHTELPAQEVERLKAEGGLQRCDNCRRILVVV